jgi:3-dehydroquinate synthase
MPKFQIKSSAGKYDVYSADGALAQAPQLIEKLSAGGSVFVVSSPRVWRACRPALRKFLPAKVARNPILFDDSESAKRLGSIEAISRQLVHVGADRHATILAIGGGVVGDVAGFAAASYLRGVRLVHIPTTLVAQVDSSIGGKTGVNLPEGKNLVGAFYPPKLVIVDPVLLRTLPHREFRSGLYEVVKYGVIADHRLFAFLEQRMSTVLRRDPAALARIIEPCIRVKADVVQQDEREGGLRQILNYGHTLGHALEAATNYKKFLHGEAIAWGMIAATLMALATDRLSEADTQRVLRVIASVGPLPSLGKIQASELRPILAGDKKARGGRVLWVLPRRIGKTEWGIDVPWRIVAGAFRELPEIAAKAGIS